MRRTIVGICVILLSACWSVAAPVDAPPLAARTATPGTPVRSGPGDSYYLTDTLPEEMAVEVYRQQPDGWCAIRPPAGSFSWVYAHHLQPTGDGLATVNKSDVPARIGSRLSRRRTEVQVNLNAGEVAEVVGHDDESGEKWYKIAPPSGEFRWVHQRDLAFAEPGLNTVTPAAIATVALEQQASDSDEEAVTVLAPKAGANWVARSTSTSATPTTPAAATTPSTPSTDITPIPAEPTTAPIASSELAPALAELELRLSRMVAEPTETWNVAALEQAAERLLSQANTVADRNVVKVTLAKIDRFAAIHRRHKEVHRLATGARPAPPAQVAAQPPATNGVSLADVRPGGEFDGVGVLRPVVSQRPGAPQFALVNEQGQVVTFLTAAPELNLQPYLGKRIGVVGNRGYIPEFRRAHVTAGRVVPLERRLLR